MNVWIKATRKRVACRYCERIIETGEYQVVCQYFMKVGNGKTWVKRMLFHPQCWITRAIAELSTRTVIETRGRKKAIISDEHRVVRIKILRRRASVMQRMRAEMGKEKSNYVKVDKLINQLEQLKIDITPYGGVPSSWDVRKEIVMVGDY